MSFSPVADQVHVIDSLPRDRARMFGDDHLELSFHNGHEFGQGGEDASHAFDVGGALRWVISPGSLVHRWPCFREVDLTWLIDDEESRYGVLRQVAEMLMEGEQACDMVSDPVLSASYLPEKVRSAGKWAEL